MLFRSAITQNRIKTDLLPVLRNSRFFDVKAAQDECIDCLTQLLDLTDREYEFLCSFKKKQYQPALLFDDADILSRISRNFMVEWKFKDKAQKDKLRPTKHKNEPER